MAFASGFSSLRRFNDAFSRRYGMPPTRLRRQATDDAARDRRAARPRRCSWPIGRPTTGRACSRFWRRARSTGVEHVTDRLVRADGAARDGDGLDPRDAARRRSTRCWSSSRTASRRCCRRSSRRVRALFDLDARPDLIARHLRKDPRLAAAVKANPGLRVPGAFDGFELGAARDPRPAGHGQGRDDDRVPLRRGVRRADRHAVSRAHRLTPAPARVAAASVDDIARHGIVAARASSIIALAQAHESGELSPRRAAPTIPTRRSSGSASCPASASGRRTTSRCARCAGPTRFPRKTSPCATASAASAPKEAEALSQAWRPWRSYAVMHIWRSGDLRSRAI